MSILTPSLYEEREVGSIDGADLIDEVNFACGDMHSFFSAGSVDSTPRQPRKGIAARDAIEAVVFEKPKPVVMVDDWPSRRAAIEAMHRNIEEVRKRMVEIEERHAFDALIAAHPEMEKILRAAIPDGRVFVKGSEEIRGLV